jgi:hypothetical protein
MDRWRLAVIRLMPPTSASPTSSSPGLQPERGAVDRSLEDLDAVCVGVAEGGGDGGPPVGEPRRHVQDPLGVDGVEEPGDEGAGQAVPGVDGQGGVVDQDGLAELGVGVGGKSVPIAASAGRSAA